MQQAQTKLPPEVRRALARKYGLPYEEAGFEYLEAATPGESRLPLVLSLFALGVAVLMALTLVEGARINLGYEGVGHKLDRVIAGMNAAFIGGDAGLKQQTAARVGRESQERVLASQEVSAGWGDAAITASIKAGLSSEDRLGSLEVETTGGIVTLRGDAASEATRHRAGRMAAAVAGVKRVDNRIVVAAHPAMKLT